MSYYTNNATPLTYGTYNPNIRHLQQPQQIPGIPSSAIGQSDQTSSSVQQDQRQNQTPVDDSLKNQQGSSSGDEPTKKERKNRPGQKFGAKKKSWVWSWFVQDNSNPNVAACDYCGKIIIRLPSDKGSPKKLSEHLRTHKLNKESINYSRTTPIDGYGVTFSHQGEPINYPPNYQEQQAAAAAAAAAAVTSNVASNSVSLDDDRRKTAPKSTKATEYANLAAPKRFLSADFDNSPYSSMKFHKHLMKFLTENKLPINVIKSQSFRQLIYDLRSDSVTDLLELTNLYSSLLEVSRYGEGPSEAADPESSAVNALANVVEKNLNSS
ncbi:uncharacterized protein RJT20DRAFT_13708 [Scheffersomyces xylosifermentans]|uniref:uncharacterized protein n=1 Tax=Scheffersomyces xylosifermentans TaxID=1304137 RepID=UPI00315DF10D